jgi:HEXXH motif-containing protein
MIAHLRLSSAAFREIGMGATAPEGLAVLDAAHRSRQLLLLRMVVDRLPRGARAGGLVSDALELLAEVKRRRGTAFAEVLTYPHVGAGLVRCMRELTAGDDPRSVGRYLATIAAAAAFCGGIDFDLGTPPTSALHIPSVGTARVGAGLPEIRLRQRSGHRTVGPVALPRGPDEASADWSPLRRLDGLDAVLDDLDPDRGAGGLFPAGRLPPAEFAAWREMFADAWTRLVTVHPGWAQQVGFVTRILTPLARQRPNQGRSASTWQAYGAIALTLPSDAQALAATMIHEVQHSKLNALMTIIDLYDRADASSHYSPWRADSRPVRGLLHGCYAFLGVNAFWSAERAFATGPRADYEFVRSELQVRQALDTLAGARGLTPDGREFVECMAEGLAKTAGAPSAPVPAPVRHLAELAVDEHRLTWRLHSMVPEPKGVSDIAAAWRSGRPARSLPMDSEPRSAVETFVPNDRIRRWNQLARQPIPESDDADLLLARRATEAAARRYSDAVRRYPDSTAAWTGLALAAARISGPDRWLWRTRPELVRAVHRALRDDGGEPPDPLVLARWLAA